MGLLEDGDGSSALPVPETCQQSAFHTAWFVSLALWYLYGALLIGLAMWPTRRRVGVALGHLALFGAVVALMAAFQQTWRCQPVGPDGHPVTAVPYENRRAFPALEAAVLAFLLVLSYTERWLHHLALYGYQRALVFALLAAYLTSLLWFHSLLQLALSLALGVGGALAWHRVLLRTLGPSHPGGGPDVLTV